MHSRRQFLKNISIFTLAAPSLFSAATRANPLPALNPKQEGYKAVVCVLLDGGNDATNMVVANSEKHFAAYQSVRPAADLVNNTPSIGLTIDDLISIPVIGQDREGEQVTLGLHPAMSSFAEICNGEASLPDGTTLPPAGTIIANSGILIEPIANSADYDKEETQRPPFLFSHNSQKDEWARGAVNPPEGYALSGWAGRLMTVLAANAPQSNAPQASNADANKEDTSITIAPLYSCSGDNLMLRSASYTQNIIQGDSVRRLSGQDFEHQAGIDALAAKDSDSPLVQSLLKTSTDARVIAEHLISMIEDEKPQAKSADLETDPETEPTPELNFPDELEEFNAYASNSGLAKQLKVVSRLIKKQAELQQNRQIFFVRLGGFDTHIDQDLTHAKLLTELSDSLALFHKQLAVYGYQDFVTTMTISDFGRRIYPNGTGTDHGWGGHQLLMGGAIHRPYNPTTQAYETAMIGTWPDLNPETTQDFVHNGRLLPSTGADQVFAGLARWMGVTEQADIDFILPNEKNFAQKLELMRSDVYAPTNPLIPEAENMPLPNIPTAPTLPEGEGQVAPIIRV